MIHLHAYSDRAACGLDIAKARNLTATPGRETCPDCTDALLKPAVSAWTR